MNSYFARPCREREGALVELVDGRLPIAAEEAVLQHVAVCAACSAALVDTVAVTMRLRRLAATDRRVVPPRDGWPRLHTRIVAHETLHQAAPLSARLATLFSHGGLKAVVAPLVLLVALASTSAGAQLFGSRSVSSTGTDVDAGLALQQRLAPEDRAGAVVHQAALAAGTGLRVERDPPTTESSRAPAPIVRF